jgi:Methyltransferase domain
MESRPAKGAPNPSSLASLAEVLLPCLDAVNPGTVVEIGAGRGEFTRELLDWRAGSGTRITAVEPEPAPELLALSEAHPELELVREPSLEALSRLPAADAVIIDGDHNYYTVSEELRLIEERAGKAPLPLLALHDVCWPHARRDTYYAPERIPPEHRQPLARDAMLAPEEPGVASSGLRYPWAAEREGGSRNGVLTAIEDFTEERDGLRLALVPAFFGLGLLWSEEAPWAGAVAEFVAPWDRKPVLERLEADRVSSIVDGIRLDRQQELLRALLRSRAFGLAERLSWLRQRGEPVLSRAWVRRVLGE